MATSSVIPTRNLKLVAGGVLGIAALEELLTLDQKKVSPTSSTSQTPREDIVSEVVTVPTAAAPHSVNFNTSLSTTIITPPMRMILKELQTTKPIASRSIPEIPAHITMDEFGLIQACERGIVKAVRVIFNANMKYYQPIDQPFLSSYGTTTTALIRSAERGRLAVVKYLVEELGANIDGPDVAGNTALMKASFTGQLPIVQYLLSRDANLQVRNHAGDTVLFFAAVCGDVSILSSLVQAGASVQVQNLDGDTPLLKAVDLGTTASVEYLLEKGADMFTENNAGKTVFHLARVKEIKFILSKRAQAIKEALLSGAAFLKKDNNNDTPALKRKREGSEADVEARNKSSASVSPLVTLADVACQGITSVASVSKASSADSIEHKKLPGIQVQPVVDAASGVIGKKKAASKSNLSLKAASTAAKVPKLPLHTLASNPDGPSSSRSHLPHEEQPSLPVAQNVFPAPISTAAGSSSSSSSTAINWKQLYERELYLRITAETQVTALRDENGRLTNTIATMQWMQLMHKVNNPGQGGEVDMSSAAFKSIADQLQAAAAANQFSSTGTNKP